MDQSVNNAEELPQVFFDERLTESNRSVLFKIGNQNVWVPKKLIEDYSKEKKSFCVPQWFYEKYFI